MAHRPNGWRRRRLRGCSAHHSGAAGRPRTPPIEIPVLDLPLHNTDRMADAAPQRDSHAHVHGGGDRGDDAELIASSVLRRNLWTAVIVCGIITVLGLVVLWPSGDDPAGVDLELRADPVGAQVITVEDVPCSYDPLLGCRLVTFQLTSGDDKGELGAFEAAFDSPIDERDGIYVEPYDQVDGERAYSFYDFQRGTPMLLLLLLFCTAVVMLGRWRGLGALAGLAVSLFVIIFFTLPSVLDGNNAVAVALVSASVIAFVALFLAHGTGIATVVALLSTFASLLLTAFLAWVFVVFSNLTGFNDDATFMLVGIAGEIDVRGVVLAGIVIGSLGVLDDVIVTQVSSVWELKRADPTLGMTELVAPALRIGRDHISSAVNTLFLAYAGAALPLLLLFTESAQSLSSVATREVVATEIVRALVGSIGLVASVPISTWLAARVLTR
jgi:uncharacterized membrane protein